MFGLFRSQAKKDRADAKLNYEMVVKVIGNVKAADLKPRKFYKVSAASVIAESFLKEIDRVMDEARVRLPAHCSETPLSLSTPDYLRVEAEKAFQTAEKVADQIGFQPFTISSTNYLLGAYILCHAWDTLDPDPSAQMAVKDILNGNYSVGMWQTKISEKIKEFLIDAGVNEDAASGFTKMR